MLTLALEHSTSEGSAALLSETGLLAGASWQDLSRGRPGVLAAIGRILEETGHTLSDIALFAVGLGPGSYTNLRTSLSTVQGFAVPGMKPVRGVSSAAALAWEIARNHHAHKITVLGDARRDRLWMMQFEFTEPGIRTRTEMVLTTLDKLPADLAEGETVATPDWEKIGRKLQDQQLPFCNLVEHRCIPGAASVGALATMAEIASVRRSDAPLTPLYIHPPVFVKPKFPNRKGR